MLGKLSEMQKVLISTYWNVNQKWEGVPHSIAWVLISTYWNVNNHLRAGIDCGA